MPLVALLLGVLVGVLVLVRARGLHEVGRLGDVEGRLTGLARRIVDGRLEVLEVDEQVRLRHLQHVLGRELEVVRLGARRREVRDVDVVTADLRRGVLERVEGGDNREPAVGSALAAGGALVVGAARGEGAERERGSGEERKSLHENDSHHG